MAMGSPEPRGVAFNHLIERRPIVPNKNPKPFKWTKSADQNLASVKRFCHRAQQTLCGEL